MMLRKVAVAMFAALTFLACGEKEQEGDDAKIVAQRADSLALHVAVYPSEGCLPLYYAEQTGMFDSLKANIRLLHLPAMEDCDTALMRRHAELAATDIARLICMRKDKFRATAVAQLPGTLALLTAKGTRINEVKQLKERLVAIERHSESDYYSDKLVEQAKLERLDIFRTQFNRHKLREEMLTNKLIEAAFLDEPFATLAAERGAKRIWSRSEDARPWTVMAVPTALLKDSRRMEQVKVLLSIYDKAVEAMSDSTTNTLPLSEVLKQHYAFPNLDVDTLASLKMPVQPKALTSVRNETTDQIRDWLQRRGWIKPGLSTDSLIINLID